ASRSAAPRKGGTERRPTFSERYVARGRLFLDGSSPRLPRDSVGGGGSSPRAFWRDRARLGRAKLLNPRCHETLHEVRKEGLHRPSEIRGFHSRGTRGDEGANPGAQGGQG